jgi:aerobic carbon-monoxide dehydrogenase small subunit
MNVAFHVNGAPVHAEVAGMEPLLEILRDRLGLTGAKPGCGEGRCGACSVLVDGQTVVSCLYPVALADGRHVRTVEGLAAPDGPLAPLQDVLLERGAVQCGACIPGVLMTLTALLERVPHPTEQAIRQELTGNICRCTGYHAIVDAVLDVTTDSFE